MNVLKDKYDFWLTPEDLSQIRAAIRIWQGDSMAESFNGARLKEYLTAWENFVEGDWEDWDIYEYTNGIGVRYYLQIALENATVETADKLQKIIYSIDEKFKANMRPDECEGIVKYKKPFKKDNYFWTENTIYNNEEFLKRN